MRRSFAWSRVGTRPVKAGATKTETKEGKDKQKKEDVEAEAAVEEEQENEDVEQYWPDDDKPAPKGTTSAHYIKFISEVLDVMDEIGNMEAKDYKKVL
ncbi:hypothetical protein G6F68_017857 [Rhizopus microsporus]|nr:hypothetical protein G6F68_017857 [Rhizopus microsporus]